MQSTNPEISITLKAKEMNSPRNSTNKAEPKLNRVSRIFEMLQSAGDRPYHSTDFNWVLRHKDILSGVSVREGTSSDVTQKHSGLSIIEHAAERHFNLLKYTCNSMIGMFTEWDFATMQNATCLPIWDWDPYMSLATIVADDLGVESLDELSEGSELHTLLKKLSALSAVQNVALVDVCERLWRDSTYRPWNERLESAGMRQET